MVRVGAPWDVRGYGVVLPFIKNREPNPMSDEPYLKISTCLLLLPALRALDGREVAVPLQGGGNAVVKQPYSFGADDVRMAVAFNIATLNRVADHMDVVRLRLTTEIFKGQPVDPSPSNPLMVEFQRRYRAELDRDGVKLDDMRIISANALRAEENGLPPSLLAALLPILEEDEQTEVLFEAKTEDATEVIPDGVLLADLKSQKKRFDP